MLRKSLGDLITPPHLQMEVVRFCMQLLLIISDKLAFFHCHECHMVQNAILQDQYWLNFSLKFGYQTKKFKGRSLYGKQKVMPPRDLNSTVFAFFSLALLRKTNHTEQHFFFRFGLLNQIYDFLYITLDLLGVIYDIPQAISSHWYIFVLTGSIV